MADTETLSRVTPTTETPEFAHMKARQDVATMFLGPGGVGIELGVAQGVMSERILQNTPSSSFLYSVDAWDDPARNHNAEEYKHALRRLSRFSGRNVILRMRFNEALDLFKDATFDFIYVDGYAHTGEEGGQTFRDWWPKLKPGGFLAGDDYDPEAWPLVVANVDAFLAEHSLQGYVIPFSEKGTPWCEYPTWFVRKP